MYIFKKIKAKLYGWKNQPSKKKVEQLAKHYRNEVMDKDLISSHFDSKEFINLIHVAKYAEFGLPTAIQSAFCLGYKAGKAGQQNDGE